MDARATLRQLLDSALGAALPEGKFSDLPSRPDGELFVLGAGKAGASMAAAFEKAWDEPVRGLVVVPYGYAAPTKYVEVVEASHPVPDAAGEAAARRMLEMARAAGADDHVVFLGSGGASSLLALPARGISLAEKQEVGKALLRAGARIGELNAVRRCLSSIKGGRLAAASFPAPVTTYLISDVPGDDPAVIGSGPTIAQDSDAQTALRILSKYGVTVPDHVQEAMLANQSARLPAGATVHMLVRPFDALDAAAKRGAELGLRVVSLGPDLEGEAREVAKSMAKQARRLREQGDAPAVILSGGELTVAVKGDGVGGCNQEFALALALALDAAPGFHALAVDTDGQDGNSAVAGAVIGPDTLARARERGLDPAASLANNDAHTLFAALGDLIDTGPTLTNVNDFRAVLIEG